MGVLPDAVIPTLADVAGVVWSRATDGPFEDSSNSTWTTTTRPTASQVQGMIASSVQIVAAKLGAHVPSTLFELAKSVIATRAAMGAILSGTELDWKGSANLYDRLAKMYDTDLAGLITAVETSVDRADQGFGASEAPRVASFYAPAPRELEW